MAFQDAPLPVTFPSGRYRFDRRIGSGGMGVVYKALDTTLNRPVAVKTIHERAGTDARSIARLRAEALAAASLDHPFVCRIYELIDAPPDTFIVMEFVEGETLGAKLARGPLPTAEVVRLGREIAEGLADAHRHGLVHRDIKPANVMVTPSGHVKLLDFGLARRDASGGPDSSTRLGEAATGPAGTPSHMAPEQIEGRPITARADIFALGVLLFQSVAGRLPFDGSSTADYTHGVLTKEPKLLAALVPGVPLPFAALVASCLAKDPAARPASATIAEALQVLDAPANTTAPAPPVSSSRRPVLLVAGIGAAVAIATVALAIHAWMTTAKPDEVQHERPIVTWPSDEYESRVSPDGHWITFVSTHEGAPRLFLEATTGGEPRRFDGCHGDIVSAVWSTDSQRLACISNIDNRMVVQSVPVFTNGAATEGVVLGPAREGRHAHALRWIGSSVFVQVDYEKPRALLRVDLDQARFGNVSHGWPGPAQLLEFDVSQDGARVVFSAVTDPAAVGPEELWVTDIGGGNLKQLTDDAFLKRAPRWLGAGSMILYASNRNGPLGLWELSLASRRAWPLAVREAPVEPESSSADGTAVTFREATAEASLWTIGPDGRGRPLTGGAERDAAPSVSGDGRRVVFERIRADTPDVRFTSTELVETAVDDRSPPAEPQVVARGLNPVVSPDGSAVAYVEAVANSVVWRLRVRRLTTGETTTLSEHFPPNGYTLFPLDYSDQPVAWSADSSTLFFLEAVLHGTLEVSRTVRRIRLGSSEPAVDVVSVAGLRSILDVAAAPDGRHLAYLADEHDGFALHIRDLANGDEQKAALGGSALGRSTYHLRGWVSARDAVVLRGTDPADGPIEAFEVGESGHVQTRGSMLHAFFDTARLSVPDRTVYAVCADASGLNVCALALATGRVRRVTDNRSPAVSYSGIVPLSGGSIVAVRTEQKRDVWVVALARPH